MDNYTTNRLEYHGGSVVVLPAEDDRKTEANLQHNALCIALCCFFLPTGILAFLFARKAGQYNEKGRYTEAESSKRKASLMMRLTIFIGMFVWVAFGFVFVYYCMWFPLLQCEFEGSLLKCEFGTARDILKDFVQN